MKTTYILQFSKEEQERLNLPEWAITHYLMHPNVSAIIKGVRDADNTWRVVPGSDSVPLKTNNGIAYAKPLPQSETAMILLTAPLLD